MTNICMCEEHKKMIENASFEELHKLSRDSLKFIQDINFLIDGLQDPVLHLTQFLMDYKGTPLEEILPNFIKVRDNAMRVFDIFQDELRKRLSNKDSICIILGVPGYTTRVNEDGSITRTATSCDFDPNGKVAVEYTKVKKYE